MGLYFTQTSATFFFAWDLAAVRISGCDNTARVDCNKFIGSNVFSTFTVEKKKEKGIV